MISFQCLSLMALSLLLSPAFCQAQDSGFDGLDTDSDGKVSKKEFTEYAKTRLAGFDQLDEFADRVDADEDGEISEDEFDGRMEVLRELSESLLDDDTKKELSKEEIELVDGATEAYDNMAELVSTGDWKELAKGMTEQAVDDYVIGIVAQGISIAQLDLPAQLDVPEIRDAQDETTAILDKYELEEIDISTMVRNRARNLRPSGADDDDGDDDGEKTPPKNAKTQDEIKAEILAAIDKNDKRWEIVAALINARRDTPFGRDIFGGKVDDSDVAEGEVFLTVTREAAGSRIAVPAVVKMTGGKGNWKYAGIDTSRTQKAVQRMMQRLRSGGSADGPRDF